ncbi:HupE/UreJ family protein [Curtobacterium aurantiacum]|uniref:HupE/UreJ family protein n=1 Tax=Curtobacterium aurantiacum TaxID=3236919 RepID=A0ABS5VEP0_9MICO|nr:HupE/UreJ family protein [Curtobacterium flaccumfaciens]MBT1544597.1 HupE/UreJ family protein [Curtobacterium flaccumfaciens pv. flaccumfaciens]MBT1587562.1 HupE/UreJ family protein [Curtobacterium flaccumfaciens pv. flaccumfaciens]
MPSGTTAALLRARPARSSLLFAFAARAVAVLALFAVVVIGVLAGASPASAHGFSSVVYADVTSTEPTTVQAKLGLEYDLMLVSVATSEDDDALHEQGQKAWDDGDFPGMVSAAEAHTDAIGKYVFDRFTVTGAGGQACTGTLDDTVTVDMQDEVPYAQVTADFTCPEPSETQSGHVVSSELFPDDETFVRDTKTIVTYDVDDREGSATLDASQRSFSTEQSAGERFWEFFRLGAEHLLFGIDHILFLVALIAGSRRLREVVYTASAFTIAHSITFILAALGVVSPPAIVVEPLIALSIAAVAGWYLWRLWRRRSRADELVVAEHGHFSLDRAGWTRLAVVFAFGLIHGLGFAGALGIHEAFSWQLLVSLLIFNVGIEAVQLAIIVIVFPPLSLLRRKAHRVSLWVTGAVTAGVFVMGMIWFVERIAAG